MEAQVAVLLLLVVRKRDFACCMNVVLPVTKQGEKYGENRRMDVMCEEKKGMMMENMYTEVASCNAL